MLNLEFSCYVSSGCWFYDLSSEVADFCDIFPSVIPLGTE